MENSNVTEIPLGDTSPSGNSKLPVQLQNYLDLDASNNGEVAGFLKDNIALEKQSREVPLTDVIGNQPGDITPQMNSWYSANIAPLRVTALNSLKGLFESCATSGGGKGVLLEANIGDIVETTKKSKRSFYRNTLDNKKAEYEELSRLKTEYADREFRFREKLDRYGRDPKQSGLLYYLVLLIVLIPEFFINFESFSALSWSTPLIASGSTMIVAMAITVAAHFTGTVFKQWKYYFGTGSRNKNKGARMLSMASVSLFASLSLVYYARSTYFAANAVYSGFGEQSTQNPVLVIGGSLLGNILLFLLGVLFAWIFHDEDPDYPVSEKERDNFKKQYDKLHAKLEKERREEMELLSAQEHEKVESAKRVENALRTAENYSLYREWFALFLAQDQKVIALLENYRGQLVNEVRSNNTVFISCLVESTDQRETLSPDGYLAKPITLKYL
jgi:hypothetical protein